MEDFFVSVPPRGQRECKLVELAEALLRCCRAVQRLRTLQLDSAGQFDVNTQSHMSAATGVPVLVDASPRLVSFSRYGTIKRIV